MEVKEVYTAEETKTNTLEEKVLEVLREEIGVAVGEEFDVYQKGIKQLTCKFERNGFFYKLLDDEFYYRGCWEYIVCNFHEITFKRKPFIPKYGERYFSLAGERDKNENIKFRVLRNAWEDSIVDYGMLALGNVFRSEKEALKNKDKVLEKLKKLQKGEV